MENTSISLQNYFSMFRNAARTNRGQGKRGKGQGVQLRSKGLKRASPFRAAEPRTTLDHGCGIPAGTAILDRVTSSHTNGRFSKSICPSFPTATSPPPTYLPYPSKFENLRAVPVFGRLSAFLRLEREAGRIVAKFGIQCEMSSALARMNPLRRPRYVGRPGSRPYLHRGFGPHMCSS